MLWQRSPNTDKHRSLDLAPQSLRPWLISLVFHATVLVILSLCVLPIGNEGPSLLLAILPGQDDENALQFATLDPADPTLQVSEDSAPDSGSLQPSELLAKLPTIESPELAIKRTTDQVLASPAKSDGVTGADLDAKAGLGVHSADGIAGAFATVADAIRGELADGDLLVAWLFDSSTSLAASRMILAGQAEVFFSDLQAEQTRSGASFGTLHQSVIPYGRLSTRTPKLTTNLEAVVAAMRQQSFDLSGMENVMSAILRTVGRINRMRKPGQQALIVILTDESGTDGDMVEQVLDACVSADVAVHVIGPTAVFGREKTRQRVGSGSGARIAWVDKGPEAAFSERLEAAYWYEDDPLVPFDLRWTRGNAELPWAGGPMKERLPSGFGVYTLTRLAIRTGGSYTMFDRKPGGPAKGQFDSSRLRAYAPEYVSRDEYLESVGQSPLRSYVVEAAQFSRENLLTSPPRQIVLGKFARTATIRRLRRVRPLLATWLARAGDQQQQQGWLDDEASPRWRASFRLTLGRLTTLAVRIDEYFAAMAEAKTSTSNPNLQVTCGPSRQLRLPSSEVLQGQAMWHLQACVSQHAGTPWATMAKWELDIPTGTRISVD